ncbi:hypothetical protein M569_12405, partial [Genlisea aurea]
LLLCFVPAILAAGSAGQPLVVKGSVYCDTCRCGFENEATKYMAGAAVRIECREAHTSQITYVEDGVTNSAGHYEIRVHGDRGDDVCDAVLLKSSDPECSTPDAGRDRARVVLTRNNGIASDHRFANSMGFLRNAPLAACAQVLQKYRSDE